MTSKIEVSIQGVHGSVTNIQVEPGTTAESILDREARKLPAGFRARLVTESAEAVSPDTQIWESQAEVSPKLHQSYPPWKLATSLLKGF